MSPRRRVCVRAIPAHLSRGIHRVADALARHAPDWAEVVDDPETADLWVLHVIGHGSMPATLPGDYAMVQYCLRTTEDARPEAWLPHWRGAKAVWSYYDLAGYCRERDAAPDFPFYDAPLGVDGGVFRPSTPTRTTYGIGTSGFIPETEGVREAAEACRLAGLRHFHLGPGEGLATDAHHVLGVDDETVAMLWSQCAFVSALRRCEGFELPALEGLACGARAVAFDAPHYRRWFGEHAEYVPEGAAVDVTEALLGLLTRPVRVVTDVERRAVLARFDWSALANGFWERLR